MRRSVFWLSSALVGALATAVPAQDFDATLSYIARDEIPRADGQGKDDNDLGGFNAGVTWGAGDGRMRAALDLGFVNNDNWSGDFSSNYGASLIFARKVGNQRYGLGARILTLEEQSTSTEFTYSLEHLGERIDLRGLVGLQIISDEEKVQGRGSSSAFGQAELTLYPSDALALSGGLLADTDGEAYGFGAEYRPQGWPVSFFLEYSEAFDDYRGFESYDEFAGGIRFVPGTSSLKSQRQGSLARLMQRYMQAQ